METTNPVGLPANPEARLPTADALDYREKCGGGEAVKYSTEVEAQSTKSAIGALQGEGGALSSIEAEALARHEEVIERSLHGFVEVGCALQSIRLGRLYRGRYASFKEYVTNKWGMKLRYAEYQIAGSNTFANLEAHNCAPLPANEAQVRPLAKLDPEEQAVAWCRAVADRGGGLPTAREVAVAVTALAEAETDATADDPEETIPTYRVTAMIRARSIRAARKQVAPAFPKAEFDVVRIGGSKSRSERLAEAGALVAEAEGIVEELKEEIEAWKDNLPENLQSGNKAAELEDCASNLDSLLTALQEADFASVEFPGMY